MEVTGVWGVSLAALQQAVRTVEPTALLVPGRILRRVIKQDRSIPGAGLTVPHRKTYVVGRDRLLASADRFELGLRDHEALPERVLLLAEPEAEKLATMTRTRALVKYWRLLFHVRVDAALAERVTAGRLTPASVQRNIERLGRTAFAEIRSVLAHDEWLLPPADEVTVYCEFLALYAELRCFAPRLLADYFPTLGNLATVDALLAEEVDCALLMEQTRLHGAPAPEEAIAVEDEESPQAIRREPPPVPPQQQSERRYCKLMERADRARERGNLVRSAILRIHASEVIGPKLARIARQEARVDMDRIAQRLRAALDLDGEQVRRWSLALNELLAHVGHGLWVVEGRLLYDIQKVCVDHERGVFALDLVRWVVSLRREPLKRPLPNQREVLMAKHLMAASSRLGAAHLATEHRQRLSQLLASAVARAEEKMRDSLRPRIEQAFDEVELDPQNIPERVARAKLIEELLDVVARRGFLTMGDLRDAISRNQIKIADVSSWDGILHGDQLLRADRRLAELLDGVYRGGELYLRLPQRISSLAFGTPKGRFLTRFGFVPFGGAFLVLEFFRFLVYEIGGWFFKEAKTTATPTTVWQLSNLLPILALGSFFCAVLHHAGFRAEVLRACRLGWQGLRWVFVEGPTWLLHRPWVRALIASQAFVLAKRYLFKPLIFSFVLLVALRLISQQPSSWLGRSAVFLVVNLLLNSRMGRDVDEVVTDWVVRGWRQLRVRVVAAAFRLIVDTFSQLLEGLERVLYTVDEWLRFRTDENRWTTLGKALLGVVWFCVTYVVRFCVTLLIEPQINPIKHFPVVTVSHKIILPLAVPTAHGHPSILAAQLMWIFPLSVESANWLAGSIVWAIPGIFGFVAWELKENWRIFAANRAEKLEPVVIGNHGETMPRLLRPGFHSGTIPKLFNRLRRADRKAYATGQWTAPRKFRDKLQHVAEAIRHGVERELIGLLELSGRWPVGSLRVADVQLGLNNVRIALQPGNGDTTAPHSSPDDLLWIELQEREGWLLGRMTRPGWLLQVPNEQLQALAAAMSGWYQLCGVEIVGEQIADALMPPVASYDLASHGLTVWLDDDCQQEAAYDLRSSATEIFPVGAPDVCARLRPLMRAEFDFAAQTYTWVEWLAIWQPPPPLETSASTSPLPLAGRCHA